MKLSVNSEILYKAINIAESVISSKNINTILFNCFFNVHKDMIEIIGTDNEIAVRTRINALSDETGTFTVNGKKFSGILKELPDDDVDIVINDSMVIDFKSKSKDLKGKYSLIGSSADEYPSVPNFKDVNSIEIDQLMFKEVIKKVIHSAALDTIKPIYNSLYFTSDKKGSLTAVATDSRRLSVIKREVDNELQSGEGVIIPLKTIHEVYKLLDTSGRCRFSYDDKQCYFKIGDTEIISRIVEGQYPNYKQVIPVEYLATAMVETKKLLNTVKRTMIFTREPANRIILGFNKNKLTIEASTPELGQAEEELSIETSSEEKISIGINAQFLLDVLREIDSSSIKIGITGAMNPLTVTPEDDSNFITVIMPIHIKSTQNE